MPSPLRPYQERDLDAIRTHFRSGRNRVLYVAPTGSGKTFSCARMISGAVERGKYVVFVAPLRNLVKQCSDRLTSFGIEHGVIMASDKRVRHNCPVQVCSAQTLVRRNPPLGDLLIIDEAHHVVSKTYQDILGVYPKAHVIGTTATPCRTDGTGLGDVFEAMVLSLSPYEMTERGYLVPARVFAPSKPDLTGIHTLGGDYVKGELEDAVLKPKLVGDIPKHWLKFARNLRTIFFAVSVNHSKAIVKAFEDAGIKAEHLDASSGDDEREYIMSLLRSGHIDVVSNVGLFTEGSDYPWIECIGLARPTQSLGLHIQIIGRGARISPGKSGLIILDHADNVRRHGFLTDEREWSLEGEKRGRRKKGEPDDAPSIKMCRQCFRVFEARLPACPECGWVPERKLHKVQQQDGELAELQSNPNCKVKSLSKYPRVRELQRIAAKMGYKPGWVWHNVQRIRQGLEPEIPSRAKETA